MHAHMNAQTALSAKKSWAHVYFCADLQCSGDDSKHKETVQHAQHLFPNVKKSLFCDLFFSFQLWYASLYMNLPFPSFLLFHFSSLLLLLMCVLVDYGFAQQSNKLKPYCKYEPTRVHQLTYFERCEKIRNPWTDYLASLLLTKWHYATDVLNITWGAFINNNVPGTQFSLGRPMCLTQCFKFTSMGKRSYY